ncbi:adenine deaminase [Segetibacter aerophilus]|uniref:Adenine deaminase n=1 Tax=Segetibacter aerophilus TaxID=670293 RepID=A0A512B802_9BACT|nr:adenine deaminase [Segetibacter aerophilus]GEO08039.1 adenine deaminase [Segetibacter aerophilus]
MDDNEQFFIKGKIVDIPKKRIFAAQIEIAGGIIKNIKEIDADDTLQTFILPGFIDSHVHIESSMLIPSEFARLAVVHGTVATVSDPHEIANVCGIEGVEYMIDNGNQVPFKFNFGAPSCVPATTFETAGAALDSTAVEKLLERKEIKYLSEMMNFPGVLFGDDEVMKKIAASHTHNKPVDGHAPGLRGEDAKKYIEAGISTDHECFTAEEALDKLKLGMKILIREGSAAKNFDALVDLLNEHSSNIMFCSDDKHPDSLVEGHINKLCARAIAKGVDVFKVLRAACINPVQHYKLDVGLLKEGDPADFIIAKDLTNFDIIATYIGGVLVAENGVTKIKSVPFGSINHFECDFTIPENFQVLDPVADEHKVAVIEALDGQLITNKILVSSSLLVTEGGRLTSNVKEDILKIAVINRYQKAVIAKGWIKNFGLKEGAIASSVAHDSHNIIVTGVDDESISKAANLVIEARGGVSCVSKTASKVIALPVGGLMSNKDGYEIASEYTALDTVAKSLGSKLSAPFMTLSFMALLVIPHLKLSDKGLFNGDNFSFENSSEN